MEKGSVKKFWHQYFQIFKSIIPSKLSYELLEKTSFQSLLIYSIINIMFFAIISLVIRAINLGTFRFFFSGVLEALSFIPFLLGILFLSTFFLYLLCRILGGEGSFKTSLKAVLISTTLFIFFSLPIIKVVAFLWIFILLYYLLKKIHHLSQSNALISIAIPFFIITLIIFSLGFSPRLLF